MAAQRTRQASLLRLHGALRAREWDAALALLARDAARCEHQTFESLQARHNPRPLFAARTLLKCHRSIPGHSIAAVREIKSSLWATAGGKGA